MQRRYQQLKTEGTSSVEGLSAAVEYDLLPSRPAQGCLWLEKKQSSEHTRAFRARSDRLDP